MGAGLGGGSANAAFMLSMLNEEFQLFLDDTILEDYAAQLGSDCPFFIKNQPAIATGTGTDLEPLALDLRGNYLVILNPGIHISTQTAYSGTTPQAAGYDLKKVLEAKDFNLWKDVLKNDFEASIFNQNPEMARLKAKLYDLGASYAAMSGSGSTLFGIFSSIADTTELEETDYFIKTMPL